MIRPVTEKMQKGAEEQFLKVGGNSVTTFFLNKPAGELPAILKRRVPDGQQLKVSTVQAQAHVFKKSRKPAGQKKEKTKERNSLPLSQDRGQVIGARRHPVTRMVFNP